MLAADVSHADKLYCFATCFSPEVTGALAAKLEAEMKSGARLIQSASRSSRTRSCRWGNTEDTSPSSSRTQSESGLLLIADEKGDELGLSRSFGIDTS